MLSAYKFHIFTHLPYAINRSSPFQNDKTDCSNNYTNGLYVLRITSRTVAIIWWLVGDFKLSGFRVSKAQERNHRRYVLFIYKNKSNTICCIMRFGYNTLVLTSLSMTIVWNLSEKCVQ